MIRMPPEILQACKSASEKEWKDFFDQLVAEKSSQIEGATDPFSSDQVRIAVKQIRELQQFFLMERRRDSTS